MRLAATSIATAKKTWAAAKGVAPPVSMTTGKARENRTCGPIEAITSRRDDVLTMTPFRIDPPNRMAVQEIARPDPPCICTSPKVAKARLLIRIMATLARAQSLGSSRWIHAPFGRKSDSISCSAQ